MKKLLHSLLLLLAAVIWGVTFVAQSDAMALIEPFTFNFIRFAIGSIVLLPFVFIDAGKRKRERAQISEQPQKKSGLLSASLLCGTMLFAASSFQQHGIALGDSVGKAGFITSLYIILVPMIGMLFKQKASPTVWVAAIISLAGLYFLCVKKEAAFEVSDLLYLACAVFFAIHIILIAKFAPDISGTTLSAAQFAVASALSGICMLIFEKPNINNILGAYTSLLYAGVLACGVAYTLQIVGQKHLNPTAASLIMSLESVVSALAGMIILKQMLSSREVCGCIIMFTACILAQLPAKKQKAAK